MIRSRLNADSIDMHNESLCGYDWAMLANCASRRADLAAMAGDTARAAREAATAVSHYDSRYLLWPLR